MGQLRRAIWAPGKGYFSWDKILGTVVLYMAHDAFNTSAHTRAGQDTSAHRHAGQDTSAHVRAGQDTSAHTHAEQDSSAHTHAG